MQQSNQITLTSKNYEMEDFAAAQELYRSSGWTDGLPFDVIELDGRDIRRKAIEERKRLLAGLLRRAHPGTALNQHYEGDGAIIYKHACALGC